MPTHSTGGKVALGTAARAYFNAGSGVLQAVEFLSAGAVLLAGVALASTPWGAPDGNGKIAAQITAPGTGLVVSAGTCTNGRVKDKDGIACLFFTVGTGVSGEFNFDTNVWTGGTITLSSLDWAPQ